MTVIDRLARLSAARLAWVIVVSSLMAIFAFILSVRTATTQATVARAQADQAIAEARSAASVSSVRLTQAVCAIADSQRIHPEDPDDAKPSTKRGAQSAAAWQVLYDTQHCAQVAELPPGIPLPPAASPTLPPVASPTP